MPAPLGLPSRLAPVTSPVRAPLTVLHAIEPYPLWRPCDEAEALFGKRGEVRHGTDRYANLEVSYLLQRLEEHEGLVILASNLKDEIDSAFTRRFHAVLHFPRPAEAVRRRLWRRALPDSAPLEGGVGLALLARLDLTGAGIVAAARTATLHAAQAGAERIGVAHLVFGVARQFQRESRLLTATDLGAYATHLPSPAVKAREAHPLAR